MSETSQPHRRAVIAGAASLAAVTAAGAQEFATANDKALGAKIAAREADWRAGAIIYQIIVDRFAPSANLAAKKKLYAAPRTLRAWDEPPTKGKPVPGEGVWTHELDFWGGDLESLSGKLDYLTDLGVDVVYLNPIQAARTNHKYDAQDYMKLSPEYGDRDDLKALAKAIHAKKMKLVLDGVFNHMGRTAPMFQEALANLKSTRRDWFYFGKEWPHGYRAWADVANLPDLNWENPEVREYIYGGRDSVVRSFLRDGADGWRLDVAYDLGFNHLRALTQAAHEEKPGSLIVGEIWNYPAEWLNAMDGTLNTPVRQALLDLAAGALSGRAAGDFFERLASDANYERLLTSWLMLDNHDTARLVDSLPDARARKMAQVLQFTLPASVNLYYGSEVGLAGADDPMNRAPMRWDLANPATETFAWTQKLLAMRRASRALKVGEFRRLDSDALFAFARYTERAVDFTMVVANPTDREVTEMIATRDSKLMNWDKLKDHLSGSEHTMLSGFARVTVPARTALVLQPPSQAGRSYNPYKRVL